MKIWRITIKLCKAASCGLGAGRCSAIQRDAEGLTHTIFTPCQGPSEAQAEEARRKSLGSLAAADHAPENLHPEHPPRSPAKATSTSTPRMQDFRLIKTMTWYIAGAPDHIILMADV